MVFYFWRPHLESNQDLSLRRALFYPLNYRDDEFKVLLSDKREALCTRRVGIKTL